MFDAKTLSEGQKAVLYASMLTRKRAPQVKINTGVAAFVMGAGYWLSTSLVEGQDVGGAWLSIMEWLLLIGTALSALSMLLWLWIERQAKSDLRKAGFPKNVIQELWALDKADLEKAIRN